MGQLKTDTPVAPPAVHSLVIPNWHPRRLNELVGCSWQKRHRLKREDRELVAGYARLAGNPLAVVKRRVSLKLTLAPGQRAGDVDSYWKSLLDSLVCAGLLVDDDRQHVELGAVDFDHGAERETMIVLEDLA
jgi:hypothetical protein